MKKKNKKGFTLVELLVVIAILGILGTVSIIGYTSFTAKAKLSNDQNYVTQLNNYVKGIKAENGYKGVTIDTIFNALAEDNVDIYKEADTKGAAYAVDADTFNFCLINTENREVLYSVDDVDNVIVLNDDSYDYYLTENYNLKVDRLDGNVNIYSNSLIEVTLDGYFIGNVTIDANNATINQYGIITGDGYGTSVKEADDYTFNFGIFKISNASTVIIDGYVDMLEATETTITTTANGVIREITNKSSLTFNNNGWVNYLKDSTGITVTNNGFIGGAWKSSLNDKKGSAYTIPLEYNVETAEDLLKVAIKTQDIHLPYITQNKSNSKTYSTLVVNIMDDIDINRIRYIPFASWSTNGATGFNMNTDNKYGIHIQLNGNNYTIDGLRNNFIGIASYGSTVKDLTLIMNYETADGIFDVNTLSDFDKTNMFYYNLNGTINAYAVGGDLEMHHGAIVSNIYTNGASSVEHIVKLSNITVDGKWIFKNVKNKDVYSITPVCGYMYSSQDENYLTVFEDVNITEDFQFSITGTNGKYMYYYNGGYEGAENAGYGSEDDKALPKFWFIDNEGGKFIEINNGETKNHNGQDGTTQITKGSMKFKQYGLY